MYLLLYFYLILIIPHIRGKVVMNTLLRTNSNHNNSSTSTEAPVKISDNTKVTINTEGGSVVPELPLISLPKESHSDLAILEKDIDKSKGKSIVPRKGVHYDSLEDNPSTVFNYTKERIDSTLNDSKIIEDKGIAVSMQFSTIKTSNKSSTASIQSTIPVVHKKPMVLSSEAISETDKRVQMEKAKTESSSKSIVPDQLLLPSVKFEPASHSSHPDMVMPIVITMLVVPMFAVLGYMALRRGQEAWKNRHYKRMDFLLDGMYND